jgi:hypothetical protein
MSWQSATAHTHRRRKKVLMILGALQEALKYMRKPLYLQLWFSMIKLKHVVGEKKG